MSGTNKENQIMPSSEKPRHTYRWGDGWPRVLCDLTPRELITRALLDRQFLNLAGIYKWIW